MESQEGRPVTTFLEEHFGAALEPEFVASAPTLKGDRILELWHAYNEYASCWTPPATPANQLWPVTDTFPREWYNADRDVSPAESYLRRALSQLMYAHGVWFQDSLGLNLAVWSHDKYYQGPRHEWDLAESYRAAFQRYLETLTYLRPLIDRGLVHIHPRATPETDMLPAGPAMYMDFKTDRYTGLDELLACEFLFGEEEAALLLEWYRELAAAPKGAIQKAKYSPMIIQNLDLFRFTAYDLGTLGRKLDPARSSYGDLSLDTDTQWRLFRWLDDSLKPEHTDANHVWRIQQILVDRVEDLDVDDVIALHEDDRWEDFRLALSHGLERAQAAGQAPDGDSKFVTEELAAAQRAVKRASVKSSILDEKNRFGRDVVIGISSYAAFAPLVGSTSAAIGASMATSRSLASLAWRWFTFGKKSADEQRIARCFSALVDQSTK
jgi:hypothetical protein